MSQLKRSYSKDSDSPAVFTELHLKGYVRPIWPIDVNPVSLSNKGADKIQNTPIWRLGVRVCFLALTAECLAGGTNMQTASVHQVFCGTCTDLWHIVEIRQYKAQLFILFAWRHESNDIHYYSKWRWRSRERNDGGWMNKKSGNGVVREESQEICVWNFVYCIKGHSSSFQWLLQWP